MDELDRAQIDAARRVGGEEEIARLREFARHDDLLLVAARELPRGREWPARADVEGLEHAVRICADGGAIESRARAERRFAVAAEDEVVGQRVIEHEPALQAIGRHMRDTALLDGAWGEAAQVQAGVLHGPLDDASQPGQRLDELVLPVALDARHAHDLPAAHRQGKAAHGGQAAVVLDLEVRDLEHGRAGTRGPLRHLEEHGPADHELRQLGDGRLRRHALAHHATTAHDGDAIGDVEYLAQLVRDEDDGRALRLELLQDAEQLLGLLRGEHGRGLVEDERPGAVVERLQDLDALLLADREVLDARVRVDLEAEALGQGADLPRGARHVEERPARALVAERQVLRHRERVHEHEVLVHHPEPARKRIGGGAQPRLLPAQADCSTVGLVEPEQDLHERRLAGAVFAHQRVDRPRLHAQAHPVVGHQPAKRLRDVGEFHCRWESVHRGQSCRGEDIQATSEKTCAGEGRKAAERVLADCSTSITSHGVKVRAQP